MSLNNIQLVNQQLTELYSSVLVETGTKKIAPAKAKLKYLGKNNQKILILVEEENLAFLTDDHLNFLTNILSACKLSLADIALVNVQSMDEEDILGAIQELDSKKIISFGIEPLKMGLPAQFPVFQVQPIDSRTYVHAPGLNILENDKAQKQELWKSLKKLFGI
jgi:hypothetical protein